MTGWSRSLDDAIALATRRAAEHKQQLPVAMQRMAALGAEHAAAASNLARLRIVIAVASDPDVAMPMTIAQRGWMRMWPLFLRWAEPLRARLAAEPNAPADRWYDDVVARRGLGYLQAFDELVFVQAVATAKQNEAELRAGPLVEAERAAARLDALNLELKAAQAAHDADAVLRLNVEGAALTQTLAAMDARGKAHVAARTSDLRFLVAALIDRVAALGAVERGHLDPRLTRPRRIRLDRSRFSCSFGGERIPDDLGPDDIRAPAPLVVVAVRGGGRRLELEVERRGDVVAGDYAFDVAGESIGFTLSAPDAPDDAEPLVTNGDAATGAADGAVTLDGRGTLLTPTTLDHHPQDIVGYWTFTSDTSDADGPTLMRFSIDPASGRALLTALGATPAPRDDLVPHTGYREGTYGALLGQYTAAGPGRFEGLRSTFVDDPPRCPGWAYWSPSTLQFERDGLHGREDITGRVKDDACTPTDAVTFLDADYTRFMALSFAPFTAGKYLSLVGAPAVGNQAAQFRAAVKLTWDCARMAAGRMTLDVRGDGDATALSLPLEDRPTPCAGSREVVLERAGRFRFELCVYDAAGALVHRDVALAVVPGIAGLGG